MTYETNYYMFMISKGAPWGISFTYITDTFIVMTANQLHAVSDT